MRLLIKFQCNCGGSGSKVFNTDRFGDTINPEIEIHGICNKCHRLPLSISLAEDLKTDDEVASDKMKKTLNTKLSDLDLSVRASHILSKANIITVGQLVQMRPQEFLYLPRAGKKTLNEMKDMLFDLNYLTFGMKIDYEYKE